MLMTDLDETLERLERKAVDRAQSQKRAVWDALQTNCPEFAALVGDFNRVFGIDAIECEGVEWARNEAGREQLEKWREWE
jgi:hypothetical protein